MIRTIKVVQGSAISDLNRVIKLIPQASPPDSPDEGWIYADTDQKLYFYNGTTWKEIAFV